MAKLQGADEVIYVPSEELVEASLGKTRFRSNARKKKSAKIEEAEAAADLYAGNSSFLVRTALIRASDYDPNTAPLVKSPTDVVSLTNHLRFADQEHVVIIAVNGRLKLLAIHETAIGGRSSASVEIQQSVKVAFLTSAAGVFMVHNHPSGDPAPSPEDVALTRRVKEAVQCVGIQLFDHVIIARHGETSFVDKGLM